MVGALCAVSLGVDHKQHYGPREKLVFLKLQSAKEEVRAHLADDFNIPEALKSLQELVRETNKYMDTSDDEGGSTILIRSVFLPRLYHPSRAVVQPPA